MSVDDVVAALREVRFGAAADWDPRAAGWLRAYYQRLLPVWPPGRPRLEPADRAIERAALDARTEAERARITADADRIVADARARGERIESATRKLVGLIIAWAMAVDAGELKADVDPGAPLLALLGAGFQLGYSPAGIEIHYATGWQIAPVPARASL